MFLSFVVFFLVHFILPKSIMFKIKHPCSLPGWCLLSRKHIQGILDLPSKLGGGGNNKGDKDDDVELELWPSFERVWAPEEVYFPTALSLLGYLDDDSTRGCRGGGGGLAVVRRALTHSQWDERAAKHSDRAHPLTYDHLFGGGGDDDGGGAEELIHRVRGEGCLILNPT